MVLTKACLLLMGMFNVDRLELGMYTEKTAQKFSQKLLARCSNLASVLPLLGVWKVTLVDEGFL